MKFQTTQKAIRASYRNIIVVSYAELQYLLKWRSPMAYNSGVYGWNCDIYDFGNVAICTGYRPFGNIKTSYEICRRYDQAAQNICKEINDYMDGYKRQREALEELIRDFIREAAGIEIAA